MPARSEPITASFGRRRPENSRTRYGVPRITCQSYGLTDAARTRTSTRPSVGAGESSSSSASPSGEQYRCLRIAFTYGVSVRIQRKLCQMALNRDRVLKAAIRLADKEGIDALSMRRLAKALGVEAMSLYNHVANKGDLVDGMLDRALGAVELPPD